jgi:hypothetical protein
MGFPSTNVAIKGKYRYKNIERNIAKANGCSKIRLLFKKKARKILQQIKDMIHPQKFCHDGKNIISNITAR